MLEETGLVVTNEKLFAVFPGPSRVVRYPDGNVVRLMTFVYRAEVEGFGTLRRSDESEELRFFRREELSGLDVIETSGPILGAYLDPPTASYSRDRQASRARFHGENVPVI